MGPAKPGAPPSSAGAAACPWTCVPCLSTAISPDPFPLPFHCLVTDLATGLSTAFPLTFHKLLRCHSTASALPILLPFHCSSVVFPTTLSLTFRYTSSLTIHSSAHPSQGVATAYRMVLTIALPPSARQCIRNLCYPAGAVSSDGGQLGVCSAAFFRSTLSNWRARIVLSSSGSPHFVSKNPYIQRSPHKRKNARGLRVTV